MGVSIAIFNQVSKIAIIPLVSVTTSMVAEEDSAEKIKTQAEDKELLHKESSVNEEIKLNVEVQSGILPFFYFMFYLLSYAYIQWSELLEYLYL